ncbi:hypothetical protein SYNPS1DRAFT_22598 [Syncephalis pseudoplumigaleata]|uniref:FH2 domain-containing protein n=1 Tax=Syncephalis pseudoplumigaleata TaxID=1712513 RepID=A0A4V1J1L1_9FUNG|nr:hypothetical protein SYNPS1DRAFT_22598 [Syncephalis pseudoplumigaleata]|eukprot:RKP25439.1 hypothetical protein SYNPS1DRAFT_22598 [Syncephalis pseudoplumigaleata]
MEGRFDELRRSKRFARILELILAIGNYLNGSSFRGGAYGFQLDALLMLKEVKSKGGNELGAASLLHYLAHLLNKDHRDLLTFMDELPHVEAAARVSFSALLSSTSSLVQGLQNVKNEVRTLSNMKNRDPKDRFLIVMNNFVKRADPTVSSLQELASRLEQELQELLIYFGEDPATKPEDFFSIIVSFSSALAKAQKENEAEQQKRSAALAAKQHPQLQLQQALIFRQ